MLVLSTCTVCWESAVPAGSDVLVSESCHPLSLSSMSHCRRYALPRSPDTVITTSSRPKNSELLKFYRAIWHVSISYVHLSTGHIWLQYRYFQLNFIIYHYNHDKMYVIISVYKWTVQWDWDFTVLTTALRKKTLKTKSETKSYVTFHFLSQFLWFDILQYVLRVSAATAGEGELAQVRWTETRTSVYSNWYCVIALPPVWGLFHVM